MGLILDENLINQMMSLTSQRGPDGSKTLH